jgi:NAD(P)-dependent dehydrogenase (short-subunit alcohol dehydrogenase family)
MRLENKVAIITGGGRGIGRMIGLTMAREGASVSVVDINAENANETANHIEKENRNAFPLVVDVTIKSQVDAMVTETLKQFGKIDILVNNAGIVAVGPIISMKEKTWDDVMRVNAKSMFLCSQAVLPHMIEQRSGKIINMSSQAGKEGSALTSAYAASKHAVIGFTQSLAKEVGEYNITANAICPGGVETEMLQNEYFLIKAKCAGRDMQDYRDAYINKIPLKRLAKPEEVANAALFLASAEADYITGIALNVAGGSALL